MKITYKDPYYGEQEFEIDDSFDKEALSEVIDYLNENTRLTNNTERRERYHVAYHIEGLEYEGEEYADPDTPQSLLEEMELYERLTQALDCLTEVQHRRLLMLSDGMNIKQIANEEDANYSSVRESILSAKEKVKKYLQNTTHLQAHILF